MNRLVIILLPIFIVANFLAQSPVFIGARSNSLANASVAISDVWSYYHNPAALSKLKATSIGLAYENRFLLKELQTQAFVVAHPLKVGVLSIGTQMYGYQLYRSTRAGIGYSMNLSENLSVGAQINYQNLRIENYGSKSTVTGELGLLAKLSPKVDLGFSVSNFNRAKLSLYQDDRFSTCFRLGLNYQLNDKVLILVELEKEVESKIRPKAAVEYELIRKFYLRFGAAYNPVELTGGFSYHFQQRIKLDLGSAWHQFLGWSPHFSISIDFNKKENE